MRRHVGTAAATIAIVAAMIVAGIGVAQIPAGQVSAPPQAQRVIDGGRWIISSPTTDRQPKSCAPEVAAACDQIASAMTAVVVQTIAHATISFVTEVNN